MLPLVLDRESPVPLSAQISAGIRHLVAAGGLHAGQAVPSTRELATSLGVSRGTVVAAYDQLVAESYLEARPGSKTRVCHEVERTPRPRAQSDRGSVGAAPPVPNLAGESPAGSERLEDSTWREAWRTAARDSGEPVDPQGLLSTRRAIAEHLRLLRALAVDPDDIFLTGGAREGLLLTLLTLRQSGQALAVQSPGYPGLRGVAGRSGMATVEVASDEAGILPAQIPAAAGAVLVTPNHLYPLGAAMPAPRRLELLARVRELDAWLIEDDFDSEYRHLGPVLPTLWEQAPGQVLHLGTFNRVLTADAHLGYLIAPGPLREELRAARQDLGPGTSALAQRAVGTYLTHGGLRRRIARRRRDLTRRRQLIEQYLAPWKVQLHAGGLAIIRCSDEAARQVQQAAAERGVELRLLADYWQGPTQVPGLIFAYGRLAGARLEEQLQILARALT